MQDDSLMGKGQTDSTVFVDALGMICPVITQRISLRRSPGIDGLDTPYIP
jgi:hypothetical protein